MPGANIIAVVKFGRFGLDVMKNISQFTTALACHCQAVRLRHGADWRERRERETHREKPSNLYTRIALEAGSSALLYLTIAAEREPSPPLHQSFRFIHRQYNSYH